MFQQTKSRNLLFVFLVSAIAVLSLFFLSRSNAAAEPMSEPLAPVNQFITYQGFLQDGGSPANGVYDIQFKLYDLLTGGTQVGATVTSNDRTVSDGLFTVELFFGNVFDGTALYMEIGVRPGTSTGAFTVLSPRQYLAATPYAHSLRPGAKISGAVAPEVLLVQNTSFDANTKGGFFQSDAETGIGVFGYASNQSGVNYGVHGFSESLDGIGVYGLVDSNQTIEGGSPYGVYGRNTGCNAGAAVYAVSTCNATPAFVASHTTGGYAGNFYGHVSVNGTLTKTAGSFKIDHPLDPANEYLYHSFVESPDMKNIYDGVVVLDEDGKARVEMPDWFQALNGGAEFSADYRYQLTPVGAAMPDLYIAQEIQDNAFEIAGGAPGMKVSWQVTAIRHDAYAESNRIPVEQAKPAAEKGTYLFPELFGQPEQLGLFYVPEHAPAEAH
jgi:hypothetical protein